MKVASVPSLIRSGGVVRDGSAKVMVGSAWGSKEGNGSDGVGMPRHQAESAPCRRRKRAKRKKQSPIRLNRLKSPPSVGVDGAPASFSPCGRRWLAERDG